MTDMLIYYSQVSYRMQITHLYVCIHTDEIDMKISYKMYGYV